MGVRRWGSDGHAITVPPHAGYSVGIGLQNHTAQIDRLEGRRTDIQQDWIHNRGVCNTIEKNETLMYSIFVVAIEIDNVERDMCSLK